MKKYSVQITQKAQKLIEKLDKVAQTQIKNYIKNRLEGCENPRLRGKALNGNLSDK